MKYETISQLLREMKSVDLSESILKDIETIEKVTLRMAYHDALLRVPFDQWYEATFKTETK
jgi:HEPN domain-containing protein